MIGIGLGFVSYAKVIDDKAEHYFSSVVPKEARGIGTLRVVIFVEVLDQSGFIWELFSTSNVNWRYIKKNATEMQLECTFNAPLMCCKIYITKMKSCIHSCIFGKCTLNVH
jgi:hypothetical protein